MTAMMTPLTSVKHSLDRALRDGRISLAEVYDAVDAGRTEAGKLDKAAASELASAYFNSLFESKDARSTLKALIAGTASAKELGISLSRTDADVRKFQRLGAEAKTRQVFPSYDEPDAGGMDPELGAGFELTPVAPHEVLTGELMAKAKAALAQAKRVGLPKEDGDLRVSFEVLEKGGVVYGFAVVSRSDYAPVTSHWGRTAFFDRDLRPVKTFGA